MKIAVLCLCLISIAFALPVGKSKRHAISESSEEKHDSRSHHSHKHHHQHVHTQSHVRPPQTQELLVPPQQPSFSSEESVEDTKEQILSKSASVSNEDEGDHDDDDDSNDTDESDEDTVTDRTTDAPEPTPLTPALPTRGDNSGRGDSVAYRMRAKAKSVEVYHKEKPSKLYKAAGKFLIHDVTEEDNSAPDTESQQVDSSKAQTAAYHFPGKSDVSMELDDKSNMQDSNEVNSRSHDKSMENDSQQQLDNVEADGDNSKPDITEDSHMSNESTEQQQAQIEYLQQADGVPEVNDDSNQTSESTEDTHDHNSIEDNEVTL